MEKDITAKIDKRRKINLNKEESAILRSLFAKTLVPILVAVAVSSTVIFMGLQFLIKKVSFGNYGLAPSSIIHNVSQFITTYVVISLINLVIMIALSASVIYIALHNIILPIMRITREFKHSLEHKKKAVITVRNTDKLLIPLVELINKINPNNI